MKVSPNTKDWSFSMSLNRVPANDPEPLALVVDDHPVNRSVLSGLLQRLGLDSLCVASGTDALRAAQDRHFDWILMDLQMPGLDGFATARRILGDRPGQSARILGITAARSARIARECRAAGMEDCIEKPVSLERLRAWLHGAHETVGLSPDTDRNAPDADWTRCMQLAGNRAEVAEELLYLMLESLPPGIEAIQAAASEPRRLAEQVHRLLGACRYTGAPRLLRTCSELDRLCACRQFRRARERLPELYSVAEQFARAAGDLLAQRTQRHSRTTKASA